MRRLFLFALCVLFSHPAWAEKEWLVLVYMAADNDLSPFSYQDLREMEAVGSSPDVDIVVFHDGARADGLRYYHMEKDPAPVSDTRIEARLSEYVRDRRLEAEDPDIQRERFWEELGPSLLHNQPVLVLPEGDSGSEKTLGAFLSWALEHYSSRRTLFLGWSHGDGYDARWADFRHGGFAFDRTHHSHMATNQMAAEIKRVLKERREGRPFDIAGSDACLTEQIETGYEWLGLARYLFGPATLTPRKGFNYRVLFGDLTAHPFDETRAIAARLPSLYAESVGSEAESPLSMASWDMDELPAIHLAIDRLGASLLAWLEAPSGDTPETSYGQLERIVRIEKLRKLIDTVPHFGGVTSDLTGFLNSVHGWAKDRDCAAIRAASEAALAALKRSVVAKFVTGGLDSSSEGVAVWLPLSDWDYREMFPKYSRSRFYRDARGNDAWARFIERLYALP